MKKLRNLTITLIFAAGAAASTGAAAGTVSHVEHDADLRAEMSEPVSAGLLVVLLANVCAVATGVRIARNRSQREAGMAHEPALALVDADDRTLDIA